MKFSQIRVRSVGLLVASAFFVSGGFATAQYKAPSQYFRKDSPGVNRGGVAPNQPGSPAAPSAPGTPSSPARPAPSALPKFKDVAVNAQFYFLNDTNRAFGWTKVTASTAKNAQGVTRPFNGETPVQR